MCETQNNNIIILEQRDQLRELHTKIRDERTSHNDFVFCADRLIRLVVEEGLNQFPSKPVTVTTPTGCQYNGVQLLRGNCGVAVIRSGEAMERGLRDCCRSIRLGKILIQTTLGVEGANNGNGKQPHNSGEQDKSKNNGKHVDNGAKVYYAKFPPNIESRKVLLMYPILDSGQTVLKAIDVLRSYNVPVENIILLTLFTTEKGLKTVFERNPTLNVVTSEVNSTVPSHFGQRYFGTD